MDKRESFKDLHPALPAIFLLGFLAVTFLVFGSVTQAFGEPGGSSSTSDDGKRSQVLSLGGGVDEAQSGARSAARLSTKSGSIIASGTWGTCPWEIDSSFVLTVYPGEGQRDNWSCPWRDYASDIERIVFLEERGAKVVAPKDCSRLFNGLTYLETIDFSGFDTANVTDMRGMFSYCSLLTSLDLSGWDTSRVIDMSSMFSGCSSLASLDVSGWDTSSVENMSSMFSSCSLLSCLDLNGWDTSGVRNMHYMFSGCSKLESLDASGWNTSSVTDMSSMFSYCSSLNSLDVSGWDTSKVTNMSNMFYGCDKLASLDVSGWNTSRVETMYSMFSGCSSIVSLDVSGWDTSSVTNMSFMFSSSTYPGNSSLKFLEVSGWDTSKVTSMSYMFNGCSSLESIDVSGWDISRVEDLSSMFSHCVKLASIDVSAWGTSRVTRLSDMFSGCTSLQSIDVSRWDTSRVTSMYSVFSGCSSLESINLSGWDTSKVTSMSSVFSDCTSLQSIDVSGWDTSKVTSMFSVFSGCSSLESIDLSGWDVSEVTSMYFLFSECPLLEQIDLGPKFAFKSNVYLPKGIWTGPGGSMTAEELMETYDGSTMAGLYVRKMDAVIARAQVEVPSCTYTGSPLRPAPNVTLDGNRLRSGLDYDVMYADNIDAGVATVIVTGKGYYSGSTNKTFQIYPASISRAAVNGISSGNYTGKPVTQSPVITLDGRTLKAGSDYTLAYKDNSKVGIATVTITGKGNYTDGIVKTFAIKNWKRLAGLTALQTMQKITAEYGKASSAVVTTNALIAGGAAPGYKDALAAAALAGSLNAPMLTTAKGALSAETKSELKRMGVRTVYIVGSTKEVSANAEKQIRAAGMNVKRIAGASPSVRAVAAAKQVKGRSDTVIIATQNTFKDALAVSPYAYATKSPILYAEANKKLSKATVDYIKAAKFKKAIIVGGPVALPASVETQLKGAGIATNAITRLAGSNQYKTARVIAEWTTGKLKNGTGGSGLYQYAKVKFQPALKFSANQIGVARADNDELGWKDALAGAALCGKNRSVLVLADEVNDTYAEAFIRANKASILYGYVFGGTSAVPKDVMDKLVDASL